MITPVQKEQLLCRNKIKGPPQNCGNPLKILGYVIYNAHYGKQ